MLLVYAGVRWPGMSGMSRCGGMLGTLIASRLLCCAVIAHVAHMFAHLCAVIAQRFVCSARAFVAAQRLTRCRTLGTGYAIHPGMTKSPLYVAAVKAAYAAGHVAGTPNEVVVDLATTAKHLSPDCGRGWGRKLDPACPRCAELAAGAAPRKGWVSQDARRTAAVLAHYAPGGAYDRMSPTQRMMDTFGQW